jgi:NAD(P)-dependent dehydrogenase (short-subunit alcohol dehydrogenase family)
MGVEAMEFSRKTVVITGAAGNLGAATARAFAHRGARLVLLDRTHEDLARAFEKRDEGFHLVTADLTDGDAVREALLELPRVDVLCNIAGGFRMGPAVHETTDHAWNFLFDLNARSIVNTARAVVPRMIAQRTGKIVNVGAWSAQRGSAGMGAYCASKSAVARITESMAAELAGHGINVNAVAPTIIDTPQNRQAMPDADRSGWATPEDVARLIVFLCSDAATAIHGASVPVGRVT